MNSISYSVLLFNYKSIKTIRQTLLEIHTDFSIIGTCVWEYVLKDCQTPDLGGGEQVYFERLAVPVY